MGQQRGSGTLVLEGFTEHLDLLAQGFLALLRGGGLAIDLALDFREVFADHGHGVFGLPDQGQIYHAGEKRPNDHGTRARDRPDGGNGEERALWFGGHGYGSMLWF